MSQIVIWHGELALSVGLGERGPIPTDLAEALVPAMTFTLIKKATAPLQRDPATGEYRRWRYIPTDLYVYEAPERRLACPVGYLTRVFEACRKLGYTADLRDVKFHGNPDDRPRAFVPDVARLLTYFKPRARQLDCVQAIMANWYGRIDAAPGFGKTKLLGAMGLLYPDAEHLVVVPGRDVLQQAREHFAEFVAEGDLGVVGDGRREPKRVTICTIQSLAKAPMQYRPDFLWVDEAHGTTGDEWQRAILAAGRRARVFGLSGSWVDRFDGAHARYEALYGSVIFKITQPETVALGLTTPVRVLWHDVALAKNPIADLKADHAVRRHGVTRNKARNDIIAGVANLYPADMPVLILVANVEHALELAARLPDFRICAGSLDERWEESFVGEGRVAADRIAVTPREQKALVARFMAGEQPKLIGTGKLGTGFSPDALSVLIRADAAASATRARQWPNRTCRIHQESGKEFAVVHDLLDQFDERVQRWAHARQREYDEMGFTQIRVRDNQEIKIRRRKQRAG